MSAFDFDTDELSKQLLPPKLRQLKHLAWVKVLINPLKWLHNIFFNQYCATTEDGSNTYDSLTTYNIDDYVLWTDKKGYVCLVNGSLGVDPTGASASETNWLEFTPNYVAVDERVYYRPQKIIFVRAMNAYFRTGLFQIYIADTGGGTFTIYIPIAKYTPLGATDPERDKAVLDYANKFVAGGVAGVTVATY